VAAVRDEFSHHRHDLIITKHRLNYFALIYRLFVHDVVLRLQVPMAESMKMSVSLNVAA
jgi:hypothetical protein